MRRGLQVLLVVLAGVALTFGGLAVVGGAATTLHSGPVSASVDSELRFFAAWYVGAGLLLLRVWRAPEAQTALIRGLCAVLVLAATGRVISMVSVGRPHDLYVGLTIVEYLIAVVVFVWQRAVVTRHGAHG